MDSESSESLFDKLKSMGVQIGAENIRPRPKPRRVTYEIESIIKGADYSTLSGNTFICHEQYPADYLHGQLPLCCDHEMEVLAACCHTPRIMQPGGRNVVFLDTETSGLAGGTGTFAFLIGIGYRTENGFELVQFFMRGPEQESALLEALNDWLVRFDVVVTFNGKTFDLPLLNTRYLLNGVPAPFEGYQHLDVLHIARKIWRERLPSRALPELEREIIQIRRSEEDIPGWMIPQIYFDYLRTGDARPLAGIFYHNALDILSLATLYGYVADLLAEPLTSVQHGIDLAAIARMMEDMGRLEDAMFLYERSIDHDLPEDFFVRTVERYALLRRRQEEWSLAAQLWRKAAERGSVNACIELAKYYEHRERNYLEALFWAKRALDIIDGDRFYFGSGQASQQEVERRIGRLYKRVYRIMD
ncbi:MAG: hypothetical protein GX491_05545 [Chloroflexi bacterium]|nr:hypothetical protein [Chloroflexota bacterium]